VNALNFIKNEIEESAYGYHKRYEIGQDVVVGVNKFVDENEMTDIDLLKVEQATEDAQVERLKAFKANRDQADVDAKLAAIVETAKGDGNVLVPMREALKARASMGEVCGVLKELWGEFKEDL